MKRKIFNPVSKAIILAILTALTTITNGITGSWVIKDGKVLDLLIRKAWFFVFVIINVFFIGLFTYIESRKNKKEKDFEDVIRELDKKMLAYEKAIKALTAIFDISQKNINKLTENLIKSSNLDLREWNIEMIATHICQGIYEAIAEVAEVGNDFSVCFYIREKEKINRNKQEYVKLIAREGGYKTQDGVGTRKLIVKNKNFCNIKPFFKNDPEEIILPDWESIKKVFEFNGDSEKYRNKYNQYVAIPICSSGNNVIGLIEIVAHENCKLGSNKNDIKEIVNKYVLCFQYFVLMAMKVQENMESKAEVYNREELNVRDGEQ